MSKLQQQSGCVKAVEWGAESPAQKEEGIGQKEIIKVKEQELPAFRGW
jgi:hypothetical protein